MGKRVSKLEATEVVQDRIVRASSAIGRFSGQLQGRRGGSSCSVRRRDRESSPRPPSAVIAKRPTSSQRRRLARGVVAPKGDPNYDAKTAIVAMFPSLDARRDARQRIHKVSTTHKAPPRRRSRRREGTAQLDKRAWDAALAAFNDVLSSPLANADADLKGRALEGAGYAKEGLEKYDEAIELFKQLEATSGMEDLGKYHRGRMLLKQGNIEEAKTLFVELQKKLEVPLPSAPSSKLLSEGVDSALRLIDPTLVKKRAPSIGGMRGNSMTPSR